MTALQQPTTSHSLTITGAIKQEYTDILTEEALAFVAELVERFAERRDALLNARIQVQEKIDNGWRPEFLSETKAIRESDWKVAPIPKDLLDRRVEITGPAEPKMIINALNSGAKVFMADIEDSLAPTWERVIEAQIALKSAVRRELSYSSPEGKEYRLNDDNLAVLIMRPRGWHLDEKHISYNGKAIPAALLDFGLYFYHNAKESVARGTGPYFYLPKLEHHTEATLWNDIFTYAEDALSITHGSIKATILIETITAVFEMDEILYSLKDYIVGLNCGRWDYIFSFIKKFHKDAGFLLPDRAQVTMRVPFLHAYSERLIQTCHKRGAFAMGGMAAAIPNRKDEEANAKAFAAVKVDKEREAELGHDGTWVAHPDLIPVAMGVYDAAFKKLGENKTNQLERLREEVRVSALDLIAVPEGTITEAGVRNNINVAIQYTAAWLDGRGAVPIFNLMEDAATAEIARTQLWQWVHHGAVLDDGRTVSWEWIETLIVEELDAIKNYIGAAAYAKGEEKILQASNIIKQLVRNEAFVEFLTLPAYEMM